MKGIVLLLYATEGSPVDVVVGRVVSGEAAYLVLIAGLLPQLVLFYS